MLLHLKRTSILLKPDQSRVLLRPFDFGDADRTGAILARIMALPEEAICPLLEEVSAEFSTRHKDINEASFATLRAYSWVAVGERRDFTSKKAFDRFILSSRILFGICRAIQSVDCSASRSDRPAARRLAIILSLRATGEGHISSITFRTGVIHPDQRIEVFAPAGLLSEPYQVPNAAYKRPCLDGKLPN